MVSSRYAPEDPPEDLMKVLSSTTCVVRRARRAMRSPAQYFCSRIFVLVVASPCSKSLL